MADALGTITGVFGNGLSQLGGLKWIFIILFAIVGLVIIGYVITTIFKTREKWNVQIRIRQEDTQSGKLYLDPVIVKARRVTLSNGLRLLYLNQE